MKKLCILLIVLLALGGCGQGLVKQGDPVDMDRIQEQFGDYHEALYEKHNVQFMESYVSEDGVFHLGVRKLNSFGEELSEEEINEIKETIYGLIGMKFPLDVYECCIQEEADLSGRITSIDVEQKRVLIVNKEKLIGMDQSPNATWVSFTEEATIHIAESNQTVTFDDLKVGQQVEAWSVGMMLESYPGQTSVVRLNVLESEENSQDISGTITALEEVEEPFADYKLKVDEQEMLLTSNTTILLNGQVIGVDDLQVGDQVKVWYVGYTLFEEQDIASQIIVQNE